LHDIWIKLELNISNVT